MISTIKRIHLDLSMNFQGFSTMMIWKKCYMDANSNVMHQKSSSTHIGTVQDAKKIYHDCISNFKYDKLLNS